VTAGLLVSSNPKTGRQNVSINGCQLKGAIAWASQCPRATPAGLAATEAAGEPFPIAIAQVKTAGKNFRRSKSEIFLHTRIPPTDRAIHVR
jgi:hypothetical protein